MASQTTHYGASGDVRIPEESERERRLRLREEERKLRKYHPFSSHRNSFFYVSFFFLLIDHI